MTGELRERIEAVKVEALRDDWLAAATEGTENFWYVRANPKVAEDCDADLALLDAVIDMKAHAASQRMDLPTTISTWTGYIEANLSARYPALPLPVPAQPAEETT